MDAYLPVWQSVNFAMAQMGFPPQTHETIKRSVGWGEEHLIRSFVGEEALQKTLKIYRRHHALALPRAVKLLPGAKNVLKFLKGRGYQLAVASNRSRRFSLIAMQALHMDHFINFLICRDEVKRGKPYPDMFRRILKQFSLRSNQALYVGDMTIDIEAGRRAGIRTVVVLTGSSLRREMQALNPAKIIRRLSQLPAVIEKFDTSGH